MTADADAAPILEVTDLKKYFSQTTGLVDRLLRGEQPPVKAVDGVSLRVPPNTVTGVIGESGCGKTTLLNALLGLEPPTEGEIRFDGTPISTFDDADWDAYRQNVRIIFQDPFETLDPKMTVRQTLREPLVIHGYDDHDRRIREMLERVELRPPEQFLEKRPQQLSGGERQRVSIARALIVDPEVVLADEPVSMLDVSTQASVLNLLRSLTDEFDVSIIYVSHDISTVATLCDEVNVMYLGRIVESAAVHDVIADPKHPYTRALVNAIPVPDPYREREFVELEGSPPDPIDLPEGCRFKDRCPERMPICDEDPLTVEADGHEVACHLHYDHEARTGSATTEPQDAAAGGD